MKDKLFSDFKRCRSVNIEDHQELKMVITMVLKTVNEKLHQSFTVKKYQLIEVKHEQFYHGSCILTGLPVPVLLLYAADLKIGIITLSNIASKENYIRFSLIAL